MDTNDIEGRSCHCPLCWEPVTKTKEIPQEDNNENRAKCSNEFYTHRGNKLYKIINPTTPTDRDRLKYE